MARRSRQRERDVTTIANDPFHQANLQLYLNTLPRVDPRPLEDRRQYHPLGRARPAEATRRQARRLVTRGAKFERIGFFTPSKVAICVRRKIRREVLHALKIAGGRGHFRKRRRSFYSSVRC